MSEMRLIDLIVPLFLMYRVELKVILRAGSIPPCCSFLMYRVELKVPLSFLSVLLE